MVKKINDGMTPQDRYNKKNTVPMQFRFNRKTDADVIERLATIANKQGYIKGLIRADIARNKAGTTE